MRSIAALALLAMTTFAAPVLANGWFNYQKNTNDYLDWHESTHKLSLRSGSGEGVKVTQTSPESVWGLHEGDTILAVDGDRVDHVGDLLKRLLAKKPDPVTMRLRSKTGERSIQVPSSDYMQIVLATPPQ